MVERGVKVEREVKVERVEDTVDVVNTAAMERVKAGIAVTVEVERDVVGIVENVETEKVVAVTVVEMERAVEVTVAMAREVTVGVDAADPVVGGDRGKAKREVVVDEVVEGIAVGEKDVGVVSAGAVQRLAPRPQRPPYSAQNLFWGC
ncbi:hypothetical protein BDV93DRAFT_547659 [Ceratobasidium sp. AG-I]|nr:hypothetical protein BDV93DRAFT_547659 [Ceratobasidium sp. AG-I]